MRHTVFPRLLDFGTQAVITCLERLAACPVQSPHIFLAVDGTCGNGHDTLFLATTLHRLALAHEVIAFDVQQNALDATHARLQKENIQHKVTLLQQNHDTLDAYIAEKRTTTTAPVAISVAMYNLGYLPGSDKTVATTAATTVSSLEAVRHALMPQGLLLVHAYGGHAGGRDEVSAVSDWCASLPFSEWVVARYEVCNKNLNPEVLFLAEKRTSP